MPPEIRISRVSNYRTVDIEFTKKMNFPSMEKFIELNNRADKAKLLDVMMISKDDEEIDENLIDWSITSVSQRLITLKLVFEDPFDVSNGDLPDELVIQAELSEFPDQNNQRLPTCVVKSKIIPRQIGTEQEAEVAQTAAQVAAQTTAATGLYQVLISFAFQAGLNQLWSMLNGQQIVLYMPLYEMLKFPSNAMTISKELIKVAKFDLIPTEWIDEILWYFPEGDAFSQNFDAAGFESQLFLENVGPTLYLTMLNVIFGVLHIVLFPCRTLGDFAAKVVKKLELYLYFNGSFRFYMEIFLDVCLIASLNLLTVDWDSPFPSVKVSNYLSIVFIFLICIWPLNITILTYLHPKIWLHEKFEERCGTIFDGLKTKKRENKERAILVVPIMFFMRRVIFVVTALLLRKVWVQLAVQTFVAVGMVIYVQWYKPYETNFANNMETFNEATILMLNYYLFCFTDFVPIATIRNDLGVYYIYTSFFNIAVHLLIMFYNSILQIRIKILKCCHARRLKKTIKEKMRKKREMLYLEKN